jgi:large subunit ribosomal protein L24
MANLNVKKGDAVMVITGKDKGKSGQIISVNTAKSRVTIEGLNMVSKCIKAKNAQEKGGIVKQPAGIDVSNVMPICPACGKPTRVGNKEVTVEGKNVKKRICKKCGAELDVAEAKSKTTAKKAVKKTKKATADKAEKPAAEKADKE